MRQVVACIAVATLLLVGASVQATEAVSPHPGVVNINVAAPATLTLLPRVGPVLALRIVEYREANGEFSTIEDLIQVRGIGEKTFAGLEPFVTVKGETTLDRKLHRSDVEAILGTGDEPSADGSR